MSHRNSNWIRLRAAGVRRFRNRDIILIALLDEHRLQPFYRSSGANSFMPGRWLPFDGLRCDGWFDKRRFAVDKYGNGDALHRFGTEEMRLISEGLVDEKIEQGAEDTEPETVNKWISFWQQMAVC